MTNVSAWNGSNNVKPTLKLPQNFFLKKTSCTVFGRPFWWVIDIVLNTPPPLPRKGVRSGDFGGHCIGHIIFNRMLVPRVDSLLGRSFAHVRRNCHCTFITHLIPWKWPQNTFAGPDVIFRSEERSPTWRPEFSVGCNVNCRWKRSELIFPIGVVCARIYTDSPNSVRILLLLCAVEKLCLICHYQTGV